MDSSSAKPLEPGRQGISMKSIAPYMSEVDKHYEELTERVKKVRREELQESEAEKLNADTLLTFHERITNFLKFCGIRILTKDERNNERKIERVLESIVKVQTSLKLQKENENVDVLNAI